MERARIARPIRMFFFKLSSSEVEGRASPALNYLREISFPTAETAPSALATHDALYLPRPHTQGIAILQAALAGAVFALCPSLPSDTIATLKLRRS